MKRYSDRAIEIINELHRERLDYQSEYLPLIDAANKLSAYEDTGLEPEQVMQTIDPESLWPTREQVEEVFGTIPTQSKSDWYGLEENVWVCTKCNMRISSREEEMNFCAVCGSPITHKGMRILMRRLEALNEIPTAT